MDSATNATDGGEKEIGNSQETAEKVNTPKGGEQGKSRRKTPSSNSQSRDASENSAKKSPTNHSCGDCEKKEPFKKMPLSKHKSADRPENKWMHNKVYLYLPFLFFLCNR